MSAIPFIKAFGKGLKELANPLKALQMEAYMKNHFPFEGVMTTERRLLFKDLATKFNLKKSDFDEILVLELWKQAPREYAYAALDYLTLFKNKLDKSHLPLVEKLIVTKSWWDSVDVLAVHCVGSILKKHPGLIENKTEEWLNSENIWLNRTAILFQLTYKDQTDEALLYHCIERLKHKKEFFIQKAIGWALRNYSRTNATWVRETTDELQLNGLARREALRLM